MNPKRFNSEQVLKAGILDKPIPNTDIPRDRDDFDPTGDDCCFIGTEQVASELEKGKVVESSNYYGIVRAWKSDNGYCGLLLQCRDVTEDITFENAEDAADWFKKIYHETDG